MQERVWMVLVVAACGIAEPEPGIPVAAFRDHSYEIVDYRTRCTFDVAGLDYYVSGSGNPATSPGWDSRFELLLGRRGQARGWDEVQPDSEDVDRRSRLPRTGRVLGSHWRAVRVGPV